MLLVETVVRESGIHGLGCFANQFIPKGTRVFLYDRRVDRPFWVSRLSRYPKPFQEFLKTYSYKVKWFGIPILILPGDNDRYMNHSDAPNVVKNHADRDIEAGEELTCLYWWVDDLNAEFNGQNQSVKELVETIA